MENCGCGSIGLRRGSRHDRLDCIGSATCSVLCRLPFVGSQIEVTPCESLAGRCDPVANGLQQACDSSHHPPTSTVTAIGEFGDIAKLAKTSLCERWYFPSWFGTQFAVDARNKRIFELWMACYENTEIASVCGCDEKTVRTVIGESAGTFSGGIGCHLHRCRRFSKPF